MKRVLVVDDSEFMRDILKEILLKAGFEVVGEAENGDIAIAKFKELDVDIVSMDINMPEKDGLKALKEIKSIDKDVKVVICSSLGQSYHLEEAKKLGADEFVIKPFVPEKIVRIFNRLAKES